MEYVGTNFETKYVVASRGAGCKYCMQLELFLETVLEGAMDNDITMVKVEEQPDLYEAIKEKTGAMQAPIFVNTETGEYISGFNTGEFINFTGVEL